MLHEFYQFVVNSKKINLNTKNIILNTVMKKEKVFAKFIFGTNNNIFSKLKNKKNKNQDSL